MTKHYCDRCGKECEQLHSEDIIVRVNGTLGRKLVELCPECCEEHKRRMIKLTDIKVVMFRDFMNEGEDKYG